MARDTRPALRFRRPSRVYRDVDVAAAAPAPARRPARAADLLLIVAFLAGIWLPMAGLVFRLDSSPQLDENRPLAARPGWPRNRGALARFPRQFEAYFNDRFGFRQRLIRWLSIVKAEGLGISPSPAVVIGRGGWLFYAGLGAYDYYRATKPFSPRQLAAWAEMFQRRSDWLAERGIRYLVVIPPNKDTIYPEFMPRFVTRADRPSRLDQLLDYLGEHTNVPVVDLRGPLLRGKARETLYYRTDTHWNTRAGYLAYVRIMEALSAWFPALEPMPRSAFEPVSRPSRGQDLATLIGLTDRFTDTADELVARTPPSAHRAPAACRMPGKVPGFQMPFAMECADPKLPRAVMFRDSFSGALIPLLSEHFRRIVYAWKYTFDRELIERERPDVVIQEILERILMMNIPELDDDHLDRPMRIWDDPAPAAR